MADPEAETHAEEPSEEAPREGGRRGTPRDEEVHDEGSGGEGGRASSSLLADWREALQDVAPYLDLGWRVAGAAALPPIGGWGLDWWLGTSPWALLTGTALGLAASVLQLRQVGHELERRSTAERTANRTAQAAERTGDAGQDNADRGGADARDAGRREESG
jgi:hypothetical protein